MSEVMETWRRTTCRDLKPQARNKGVERLAYRVGVDLAAVRKGEDRSVRRKDFRVLSPGLLVLPKQRRHAGAKRHEPALVELGLSDQQQLSVEVDITQPKTADFADPQPQAVEDGEDHMVSGPSHRRLRVVRQAFGKCQQPPCCRHVEDKGDPFRRLSP